MPLDIRGHVSTVQAIQLVVTLSTASLVLSAARKACMREPPESDDNKPSLRRQFMAPEMYGVCADFLDPLVACGRYARPTSKRQDVAFDQIGHLQWQYVVQIRDLLQGQDVHRHPIATSSTCISRQSLAVTFSSSLAALGRKTAGTQRCSLSQEVYGHYCGPDLHMTSHVIK